MKIGIDIDEVVVEFIKPFLEFYNGKKNTSYVFHDITNYDFDTILNINREEAVALVMDFYEDKLFDSSGFIEGAREAISKLAENNELLFITARPASISHKTESFFKKYFPNLNFKIFHGLEYHNKKSLPKKEICLEKGVSLMVEDNRKTAMEISQSGITCFLLERPWNIGGEEHENLVRVKSWEEILQKIGEMEK